MFLWGGENNHRPAPKDHPMLFYLGIQGGTPQFWGKLLHADTGYSINGVWSGFIGALTAYGNIPWSLGRKANGYKGTFILVQPD